MEKILGSCAKVRFYHLHIDDVNRIPLVAAKRGRGRSNGSGTGAGSGNPRSSQIHFPLAVRTVVLPVKWKSYR